jgi:hypothetical protein
VGDHAVIQRGRWKMMGGERECRKTKPANG